MIEYAVQFFIAAFLFWIYLVLVAIGLQFIYGVTKTLNLAHGSFFVLGGYLASVFIHTPYSLLVILGAGALAGAGLYIVLTRFAPTEFHQLLATFTIFWLLEGVFRLIFGVGLYNTYQFAQSLGQFFNLPAYYILALAVALTIILAIYLFLHKTSLGLFLRATMDNKSMAEAMGVNVSLVGAIGVSIGVIVAVLGGALSSMWLSMSPGLAGEVLLYAFAVVAMGGLGNIFASVAAAAIVSLLRSAIVFTAPELEFFALYLAVALVLLTRPQGLFVTRARYV
ncbi:MAG: branched-chain amino acid ABC transporter permease [Desulfurococcaceae archaeon]